MQQRLLIFIDLTLHFLQLHHRLLCSQLPSPRNFIASPSKDDYLPPFCLITSTRLHASLQSFWHYSPIRSPHPPPPPPLLLLDNQPRHISCAQEAPILYDSHQWRTLIVSHRLHHVLFICQSSFHFTRDIFHSTFAENTTPSFCSTVIVLSYWSSGTEIDLRSCWFSHFPRNPLCSLSLAVTAETTDHKQGSFQCLPNLNVKSEMHEPPHPVPASCFSCPDRAEHLTGPFPVGPAAFLRSRWAHVTGRWQIIKKWFWSSTTDVLWCSHNGSPDTSEPSLCSVCPCEAGQHYLIHHTNYKANQVRLSEFWAAVRVLKAPVTLLFSLHGAII